MSHPNVRVKGVGTDVTEIDPEVLVSVPPGLAGFAEQRTGGEFAQKAVYFDAKYIWFFGLDDVGALIAVPTRRR